MKKILLVYSAYAVVYIAAVIMLTGDPSMALLVGLPWLVCMFALPVMLVVGLIYGVRNWKTYRMKGFIPIAITVVLAAFVWYVPPFIQAQIRERERPLQEVVISWLKQEKIPDPFDGRIELPEEFESLSIGGEVEVQQKDGRLNVFFYTAGGLADSAGMAYITDETLINPNSVQTISKSEGNWYRFTGY